MKYLLLIAFVVFVIWGYATLGYDWSSVLLGILTGYMLGMLFE